MISISLCMIVKNEEAILARCLDSCKGLMDEIIIVDTGSTDRTREIALQYTNQVYDFQWVQDFAAARNYAFSKASCDYIFSADADEVLDTENQQRLLDLKTLLLPEIDIVQMKYVNVSNIASVYNSQKEYRPKLFKRLRTFTWISPIHETVRLEPIVFDSDIEILHMQESNHAARDFSVFVHAIKQGTRLEPYVLTMFCKELYIAGTPDDFHLVADIFKTVLPHQNYDDAHYHDIACILARIYRLEGNVTEFFKVCLKEAAAAPPAEICMELGEYFLSQEDYAEAVLWFINASSETQSILDIHSSGDAPLQKLAQCYAQLASLEQEKGNTDTAKTYTANSQNYLLLAKEWTLPEEL